MSNDETGKPQPPVSLAAIDRLADRYEREEMERLLAATDEELDAELKEAGFAPDDAADVVKAALAHAPAPAHAHAHALAHAPALAPAPVVSLAAEREKRGRGVGWIALVAAAAAVIVLGGGGAAIVALRTPDPAPTTTPGPSIDPTPPRPPPEVLAKQDADVLRRQAATECAARKWATCVGDLEKARALDPAGAEVGAARRLRAKADRGLGAEETEAKLGALTSWSLPADVRKPLAVALAPHAGQPARVVCARGPGPEQLCGQIAAAMTKAGWVVTREVAARDAGVGHGLAITVAEGSDEATEEAAEGLADGLEQAAALRARGPDDVPAVGPGVTLTVGER